MTINLASNTIFPQISGYPSLPVEKKVALSQTKKTGLLDKFETNIRNSADLNDTVKVPRTIFKGYLAIMTGTSLMTLAMVAKNTHKKMSNVLSVVANGLMIFGTYSFVRPYIMRDSKEDK